MTRTRIAWAVALSDIVLFLGATLAAPFDPSTFIFLVGIASYAGVGALLVSRVPANPIGALLLAAGTTLVGAIVVGMYATLGSTGQPPWPGADVARVVGDILFFLPFLIALVLIPLVFPDGRLVSPRFRWAVACAGATVVLWILGAARLAPVDVLLLAAVVASFASALLALGIRYRLGSPTERQQVKWLLTIVGVALLALIPSMVLSRPAPALADILSSIAVIAMLLLPVVIGIAVLRYRLYEIDRIVSRGIAYAIVSGVLVAVFAVVVIALSTILSELAQGPSIAVAASTLAVFAISQPVVRRVRRAVDRRFDRARYDAEGIATSFSQRLRDEVDMESVTSDLATTATAAVAPTALAIWLRSPSRDHLTSQVP